MPTHVYHPLNSPPTWWDRVLVHPLDNTVAAISILFGLTCTAALIYPGFIPSTAMDGMPWGLVCIVAAFLALGGVLELIGLHWTGDVVSHGWALERFGWLLSLGGFATYAVSVFYYYPNSLYSWGVPASLGLGCLLRFWSVVQIERSTRRLIAEVRKP